MFRRSLLSLLFTVVAMPALAQGADLYVDVANYDRQPTLRTTYTIAARWDELVAVDGVVLEFDVPGGVIERLFLWNQGTVCDESVRPVRCTLPREQSSFGGVAVEVRFPAPGTYTATARISSASNADPNPANDTDSHTIEIAGLPALHPYGRADYGEGNAFDPAAPGRLTVGLSNNGEPATNAVLRVTLPEGGLFTAVEEWSAHTCALVSEREAVCRFDSPFDFNSPQFTLNILTPDRPDGGTFPFVVTAEADEPDYEPADDTVRVDVLLRDLIAVTNDADAGPGSLRQAMLDSRDACGDVACVIASRAFRPLVIQPRTALPELRGRVKLEGSGRTMVLDGSLLPAGDAIRFDSGCEFRVNAMVIRNFQGHAVEVHQNADPALPEACAGGYFSMPVSITANELAGNGRGVVTKNVTGAAIYGNVIHDNRRAGIFADGGYYVRIEKNEVYGNGASGIYVNADSHAKRYLPAGADVIDNVVRDNGEWGIARTAHGSVFIYRNAIFGNNLYGIDYGLDLSTPDAPNKPVLTSAVYDPVRNVTVIRGHMKPSAYGYGGSIEFYASASLSRWGYPEAQRSVGATSLGEEFEEIVDEDLRGQWITATGMRIVDVLFLRADKVGTNLSPRYQANDTSELSDAIRVE
jgi:hypothetical protein